MPVNGFSVGRDVSVQIFGQTGTVTQFDTITSFDKKQMTDRVKVKPLNGPPIFLEIPDGWEGSISVDRSDSNVDDYFAGIESSYYAGLNIGTAQITETITEASGATTQYRYTGVQFKLDDGGAASGDNIMKMKMSWVASRRYKVK